MVSSDQGWDSPLPVCYSHGSPMQRLYDLLDTFHSVLARYLVGVHGVDNTLFFW